MRLKEEFDSLSSFRNWCAGDTTVRMRHGIERVILESWAADGGDHFSIDGFCIVCNQPSHFDLDKRHASHVAQDNPPNWREKLKCQECHLNNRLRASVGLIRVFVPDPDSQVWIHEQTTPLYRRLASVYPNLVGSEFCGVDLPSGTVTERGFRHEDVTASSFADAEFDAVLSFDVLEHVPSYRSALVDIRRTVRPGGVLIASAPFLVGQEHTQQRSRLRDDKSIEHLLPPIYHGDPMASDEGILCFQHFGWDILSDLRQAGFTDASVVMVWSDDDANIGPLLPFFVARA